MKRIVKMFLLPVAVMGAMSASALELVTNGGFENGPYTETGYKYCTPNYWSGGTGLKHKNDTTWCSGVYAGNYAVFFQGWDGVSQTLNFPVAGTYRLTFAYIARGGGYSPHYRCVNLGSKRLLNYTASSTSWSTATVDFEVMAPGPQTLSTGATSVSGDMCSCADNFSCYLIKPAQTVTDCSSWRQVRAVLEAGYSVRLVKDVVQDSNGQVALNGSQKVTVDLNGHTILATSRVFDLTGSSAKLTLIDSVGGGAIEGQNTDRSYSGGCVKVCSGAAFVFNGGTIRNFKLISYNGGAIFNEGTVTIDGGSITNCSSNNGGGAIYSTSTVTMSSGTIVDCRAEGSANGGGIFHTGGTLTLSGGMITNCESKVCGGGVRVTGGTINLSGTKIIDCRSNRNGNGIQLHGSITFNMTGGEVVGCRDIAGSSTSAGNHGGAILVWDSVTANFKGGVVANNSSAAGGGAITYGGTCAAVTISGGVFTNNVCSGGKELLYRSSGSKTASVTGGFFDKNPTTTSMNTSFDAVAETVTGYVAGNPGAANKDGELSGGTYPFCPTNELYTGVGVTIAPDATLSGSGSSWKITSTNFVECSNWEQVRGNLLANNNVKLLNDIEQGSGQQVILQSGQNVTLDLCGKTITMTSTERLASIQSATLTIADSVGGGVIDGSNVNRTAAHGACVGMWNASSVLNFTGGTIRNFKNTVYHGGAFYASAGKITMSGGTISNCYCTATETYGYGGAICCSGTFKMTGGRITDCRAARNGGGIWNGGTVRIEGGLIDHCRTTTSSGSGGALFANTSTTTEIYGGTFSSNSVPAGAFGGVAYAMAVIKVYGGYFVGNEAATAGYCKIIHGTSWNVYGYIYGGVFNNYNPVGTSTTGNTDARCLSLQNGATAMHIGDNYVVGVTPATDKDAYMTAGTYTFCPTNVEYAAAGISIAGNTTFSGSGTSWKVAATNAVEVSDWMQMRANLMAGNSVKLVADVEQNSSYGAAITPTGTTTLDLNGYTMRQSIKARMFEGTGTKLTITDTSAEGTGTIQGDNSTMYCYGRVAAIYANNELVLEKGTIKDFNGTWNNGSEVGKSGAFWLQSTTSKMTMNGGTIQDCKGNAGAAVYVDPGGTFTMNGGIITNCTATGSGGAIYCNASKIKMTDGLIVGNTSGTWGGGVSISSGATMTFEGGEISYNTANGTPGGGGICSSGKVTMKGGRIVGNKAPKQTTSTAFYSNLDDSDLIYGGVIEGTIYRDATADLYIYGGVYDRDQSAYCASGYTCYKVGDNYVVGVTPATDADERLTGGGYTFCPTNEIYESVGLSLAEEATLIDLGSNWKVESSNGVQCAAWNQVKSNLAAGNDVVITNDMRVTSTAGGAAGKTQTLDLNGHTLLMDNAASRAFLLNNCNLTLKGEGVFDGNGITCTYAGQLAYLGNVTAANLTIEDGVTIQNMNVGSNKGGAVYIQKGSLTMNGGMTRDCKGSNGAAVYLESTGAFTMNSGVISNCTTTASGAAVFSGGTLVVKGGEFLDNHADAYGGVFYCQNNSSCNVYGGYFRGNTANSGGRVLIWDSWAQNCNVYGGVFDGYDPEGTSSSGNTDARAIKLQNGKKTVGSNIYVIGANMAQDADEAFTVGQFTFPLTNELYTAHGVAVAAGSSVDKRGNNWVVEDGSVVECGTWQEVAAAALQGRNIKLTNSFTQTTSPISTCYLGQNQQVTLDLNGCTITKANAVWLFAVSSNGAKLTIEDSAGGGKIVNVSGGSVGADGGCIYVPNGELVLNGGTMSGFKSTKSGGCIYVNTGATFTMNGGKITGCTSAGQGGGVYVSAGSRFEMYGGEISGNTVTGSDAGTGCGGGIRNAGTTIIYGGRIASNSASRFAGAIYNNGGTLEIRGGTLTGNSAPSNKGGAIDCDAGRITFYGGVVTGNTGGNFLIENANGMTVCGGVFDANPASVSNAALGTGCVSRPVGSYYVVGKEALGFPIDSVPTIVNGEYTFCPTNAEYAAAGIAVDIVGSTFDAGEGVWKLTAKKPIGVSTWEQLKATLESGFDAKLTADMDADSYVGITSSYDLTIDMNGKTVTRTASTRLFNYTKAKIRLTDSVGGGCFTAGTSTYPYRASFALLGGGNSTFVLDGDVTIDGFKAGGSTTEGQGGAFSVESTGSLIISNGVIRGCSANTDGGAVYAKSGATITMVGGMITNCTAASNGGAVYNAGTFAMSNGVITACQAIGSVASSHGGGGVYNAGGTFDMAGGLITGCSATNGTGSNAWNGGGGICNASGTTYIRGTISNCTARCAAGVGGRGGTIYLYDEGAIIRNYGSYTTPSSCDGTGVLVDGGHFTMYGGRICDNYGPSGFGFSGIVMWSSGNTFTMYGGIVAGNTNTSGKSDKQIAVWSGKVVLNGGLLEQEPLAANVQGNNGTFAVPCYRKVGDWYVVGKAIGINADDELTHGIYTFCLTNALYDAAGLAVDTENSTLAYTNEAWCLTSNAGAPVNASDWAQLSSALEAGYSVKLANDIVQTGGQPTLAGNQVVTVDLNGYTIDRKSVSGSYWCFATSSTNVCLTITDTSAAQTGRILGDPTKSHGSGGNALCVGKGKMIINGGIFEGMYATAGGGCAYVTAGATLEMNGGTITGCKTAGTGGYGAGVRCHGTFVMNGGTITNCTAEYYGGGVAVGSGATFQMNGGTIVGCKATGTAADHNGGGVWTAGTFEMDGGVITNCSANASSYGGAIYQSADAGAVCNLKRGTIAGCGAGHGGAYAGFGGTCNIYDGMSIASTEASGVGSVFVQTAKAKLNVYGGTFTGTAAPAVTSWEYATAAVYGGCFDIASADSLFNWGSTTPVLNVYGGVYGADPTGNAKKTFGTGCTATKVGDEYVVGKGVYVSGTTLKGGQYWFCPTNALYAACGLTTSVDPVEQATTPTTWTIDAKWYCICGDETKEIPGHVHEKVMFLPWAPTTTLPTGEGNYYLTDDVQLTAQWAAVNGVVLDLAGHSVTQTTANARVMYVPANVSFTLTDSVGGGKLTGGNLTTEYGGGVYVHAANAKFIMYGGSICGNTAKSGAGMYVNTATSSVKIYGGFVENNLAAEWGGGLCLSGGTQEIRNCVIRNNQATTYRGGAVRFDGSTVEFIDCVITNNVAANHGAFSANNGYSTKIALGGTTVITNNHIIGQTAQNNLGVESGRMYTASTLVPLTDGAQIGVSTDVTPGSIPVTGINATDYAKYFFSDNAAYSIVNDLSQVKLTTVASVCAKIGETPYSSLQLALSCAVDGDTVKLVRNTTESVIVGSDGDITIDLAGYVLKANGGSALTLSANANLTLTNSNETVTNYFTVGSNGLWTWNNNSKTGAVDYETLTARPAANTIVAIKGGCITGASAKGIYQNVGSKLIINGVSIVGNTGDLGGGVYQTTGAPAYLTLNGGRICGNRSTCHAGGLYAHGGGTFTINGGDVAFNIAASVGGGICNGNLNLNGGRLSWNSCAYEGDHGGGGIYTPGTVVMTGGEIVGNSTTKNGGGVCAAGTFKMSGGIISNCTASALGGGVYGSAAFTLTGGEIVGNTVTTGRGGGVLITGSSARFEMSGGSISGNTVGGTEGGTGNGGGVIVEGSATCIIRGGFVKNNTANRYGGGIFNNNGKLEVYGGEVSGNKATTGDGGGIQTDYVADGVTSTKIYGGVVKGNSANGGHSCLFANMTSSQNTTVYGGVFDKMPTSASYIGLASGCSEPQVGDNWVVGADAVASCGALVSGRYTFCLTNDFYAAAGVTVDDEKCEISVDGTTSPTNWVLTETVDPIEVHSWSEMKIALTAGKNVKLTKDVAEDDTAQFVLGGDQQVTLDLNGYAITKQPNLWLARVTSSNAKLTLTDTSASQTGRIVQESGSTHAAEGAALSITAGEVVIKGGTYSGLSCQANGGFAYVASGARLTLDGGIISNCTTTANGGAIYNAGTFVMSNGVIVCCASAVNGGAVLNAAGGSCVLADGRIADCTATGSGAVYNYGSLTMNGGTIENCSGNYGGGICNSIQDGQTTGGAVGVMNGGTIRNCSGTNCGAIYVKTYTTFTMNGGVLLGNTSGGSATAETALFGGTGTLTLNGGVSDSSLIGDKMASGKSCELVGDNYVVGMPVVQADDTLAGGVYTFNPTNAEYAAAGVALADGKGVRVVTAEPDLHYVMDSDKTLVVFDAQSGTGAEAMRTISLGDRTLGSCTTTSVPTRGGYVFCGYFTGKDGTGSQVYDSAGNLIGIVNPTQPVTLNLYAYWHDGRSVVTTTPDAGTTLTDATVYRITGSVAGGSGVSGLVVPENSTVYLCIDSNATFTAAGGDGSGQTAGGAGIKLPSTSKLVVFGGGALTATGGKAANGTGGSNGGNGSYKGNIGDSSGRTSYGGAGGAGGNGGGGAGAGIGGVGGAGGSGGAAKGGPSCTAWNASGHLHFSGYNGNGGANGSAGGACGTVYVSGGSTVSASGGASGTSGGTGGGAGAESAHEGSGTYRWLASPGGGGGCGAPGTWSYGIGGGGGGGGGGGSGGSGGTVRCTNWKYTNGAGGTGSAGWPNGGGSRKTYSCDHGSGGGGYGGAGGAMGSTPGSGAVWLSDGATANAGTQQTGEAPVELTPTLVFMDCGATAAGTASQVASLQYGLEWRGENVTVPTRTGCTFGGYYTEQYGIGTQHVGADGAWTTPYGAVGGDRKLYAKWQATISVVLEGEGTQTGAGEYIVGRETTITATPAAGWTFFGWIDGITSSSRTFVVTTNSTYTACFGEGIVRDPGTGAIIGGVFTFDPTDAAHAALGIVIDADSYVFERATTPKTWGVAPLVKVAVPEVTNATVTNVTVNGKSVPVAATAGVPTNGTIVVWYAANPGYVLTADETATLVDVTGENRTIDASGVTVESNIPVEVDPVPVVHTTRVVLWKGVPVMPVGDVWFVQTNTPTARVVYAADRGYYFSDGATAVTNVVDATTDPATLPAAPDAPETFVPCTTWEQVKKMLEEGIPVKLIADIDPADETIVLTNSDVFIDLNGHEVRSTADPLFKVSDEATLTLTGDSGSLTGNVEVAEGGTFTMDGGTYAGEITVEEGGTFTMNGGTFDGELDADEDATVVVNGGLITSDALDEYLAPGKQRIDLGGGKSIIGQDVVRDPDTGAIAAGVFTFNPTNTEYVAAGVKLADGLTVAYREDAQPSAGYVVGRPEDLATHVHDDLTWHPWTSSTALPSAEGAYYLVYDVSLTNEYAAADGVTLCLNGKTVKAAADCRVASVGEGVTFLMTDCRGTGVLTGGVTDKPGAGVFVEGEFDFFGGSITGNVSSAGALATSNGTIVVGGRVRVADNAGTNVCLFADAKLTIADDPALGEGAELWMTTGKPPRRGEPVAITTNGEMTDTLFFHADVATNAIEFAGGRLWLTIPTPIMAALPPIAHTITAVYTNRVLSSEAAEGQWYAWSNQFAYVVYTPVDGYVFTNGQTVVTNAVDTTTDPATAAAVDPARPIVATVAGKSYASLQEAIEAAAAGETISLVADQGMDGLAVAKDVTLDLNGKTLTNAACTVSAAVTVANSVATGGLVNAGTVTVAGTLDVSALGWGAGGFIPGPNGSLAIANGGLVKMGIGDGKSPNWMLANKPDFFDGSADGAKLAIGAATYTKAGAFWSIDGAAAKAEVLTPGSLGQSGDLAYVESFDSLAAAVMSVRTNGTVTLVADVVADEIVLAKDLTLDLDGRTLAATAAEAIALKLTAGSVVVTNGTVSNAVVKLDGSAGQFAFADSVVFADTAHVLMTDEFIAAVAARTASVTGFEAAIDLGDGTACGWSTLQDAMDAADADDTLRIVNDLVLASLMVKTNCVLDCNTFTCRVDGVLSSTNGAVFVLDSNSTVRMGSAFDVTDGFPIGTAEDLLTVGVVKVMEPADGVTFTDAELAALAAKMTPYDPAHRGYSTVVIDGAIWLAARFTVSYDAMDGKWADGTTVSNLYNFVTDGYLVPETAPTRANYEFAGWYASWTNGARKIVSGDPLDVYADHTLYAKWNSQPIGPVQPEKVLDGKDTDGGAATIVMGATTNADGSVTVPLDGGLLALPERIGTVDDGKYVKMIGRMAYQRDRYDDKVAESQKLCDIRLPSYLTTIGDNAFNNCDRLTNVTFTATKDYKTNEKTALVVGSRAFAATALERVVFPAGSVTKLSANAFADCPNLKELVVYGKLEGIEKGCFAHSGNGGEVTVYLSPDYAADADFVAMLTKDMNTTNVRISKEPLGQVKIKSIEVVGTAVTVTFKADLESPWVTVNENTVALFYTDDLAKGWVGTGMVAYPNGPVTQDAAGVYTAKFTTSKAIYGVRFYRLTIGAERK